MNQIRQTRKKPGDIIVLGNGKYEQVQKDGSTRPWLPQEKRK